MSGHHPGVDEPPVSSGGVTGRMEILSLVFGAGLRRKRAPSASPMGFTFEAVNTTTHRSRIKRISPVPGSFIAGVKGGW